ncbi:MAG: hypothetical protein ACRDP7_37485 [Trebonia sp.]
MAWDVVIVPEVRDWLHQLRRDDPATLAAVSAALALLGQEGPALGPPLADAVMSMTALHSGLEMLREFDPGFRLSADNVERAMALSYLRELRPGPRGPQEPRLLFTFDQGRAAVVLVAGTEEIDWTRQWYVDNVPLAHARYIQYLREGTESGNA